MASNEGNRHRAEETSFKFETPAEKSVAMNIEPIKSRAKTSREKNSSA
jgi:hypothetical protein